jgi:hypothetical protein
VTPKASKIKIQAIYRENSTPITVQCLARTREKAPAQEHEETGKEQGNNRGAEQGKQTNQSQTTSCAAGATWRRICPSIRSALAIIEFDATIFGSAPSEPNISPDISMSLSALHF